MLEAIADGVLVVLLSVFALGFSGGAESGNGLDSSSAGFATSTYEVAEVVRVIDGDTFDTASGERVRLLGVDTPEREECYAEEATAFLRGWIEGRSVYLESDTRDRDEYGRLLRYVFTDAEPHGQATSTILMVNQVLVEEGYAVSLPIGADDQYRSDLYASHLDAEASGLGLWSACVQ